MYKCETQHLTEPERKTFPIFVSSICSSDKELEKLRSKIYHDVGRTELIFIDEEVNRDRDLLRQDDLEVADELISRIRQAKAFVCILGGSQHGSPIKVQGQSSRASFFEVELFQAALLNKNIHIFVRDEFAPEPRLQRLLDILPAAFPEWRNIRRQSEREILSSLERVVDRTMNPRLSKGRHRRRLDLPHKCIREIICNNPIALSHHDHDYGLLKESRMKMAVCCVHYCP